MLIWMTFLRQQDHFFRVWITHTEMKGLNCTFPCYMVRSLETSYQVHYWMNFLIKGKWSLKNVYASWCHLSNKKKLSLCLYFWQYITGSPFPVASEISGTVHDLRNVVWAPRHPPCQPLFFDFPFLLSSLLLRLQIQTDSVLFAVRSSQELQTACRPLRGKLINK